MKPYGKKKCQVEPCECCHSEAQLDKTASAKRARREAKKNIYKSELVDVSDYPANGTDAERYAWLMSKAKKRR